jgi:hypothetical protein
MRQRRPSRGWLERDSGGGALKGGRINNGDAGFGMGGLGDGGRNDISCDPGVGSALGAAGRGKGSLSTRVDGTGNLDVGEAIGRRRRPRRGRLRHGWMFGPERQQQRTGRGQ